jgi:hypothetical protein
MAKGASKMRHEQFVKGARFEVLDLNAFQVEVSAKEAPFQSASAVPDIPPALGKMLVTAYVTLLATFAFTMAHSRQALFAIAICAVFLTMYLCVPRIFLGVEPKQGKRPSFGVFLDKGLETYAGHCSGRDALIQMLIVPVLLTVCALAMGVVALVTLSEGG